MRIEASFICDDIRLEQGNKFSLMGIYDLGLLLPQIPASVPKLCLFQKWIDVPRNATLSVELRGTALPGPVPLEPVRTQGAPGGEDPAPANILVSFAMVNIVAEGELEFLTYWEGDSTPAHTHRVRISKLVPTG